MLRLLTVVTLLPVILHASIVAPTSAATLHRLHPSPKQQRGAGMSTPSEVKPAPGTLTMVSQPVAVPSGKASEVSRVMTPSRISA